MPIGLKSLEKARYIRAFPILLNYGVGKYPIGYSTNGNVNVINEDLFNKFIQTIEREEWAKSKINEVCSTFTQKMHGIAAICELCGKSEAAHVALLLRDDYDFSQINISSINGKKMVELIPAEVEDLTIHFPKNKKWIFEGVKDGQYQFRKGMFFIGIDPDDEFLSYFDKCEIGSEVEIKITTV